MQRDTEQDVPTTPAGGDLLLHELGIDPDNQKPLFVEKLTGKQYYVEAVKAESELTEDELPF